MSCTKRVILAEGSRLLREMLQRVIDRADHLEVMDTVARYEELTSSIAKFDPWWVIVSSSFQPQAQHWILDHPSVRFIFLAPHENHIQVKWQRTQEEEYSDLSLSDFIDILEKDLEPT